MTIGSIWAQIQPLSAAEAQMAAQAGVHMTHLITTRYRPDLTSATGHDLRLVESGRLLEITTEPIDLEERHRELQIQCKELLPG